MAQILPYNEIFSCCQIFAVLSKKYGHHISRILIFAVGNISEKYLESFPRKSQNGWHNSIFPQ